MALEEKLNEMWQPAEVLKRIASFVDSEFRNVGNDELTSALENIRDTSREMHNRDTKKDHLKNIMTLVSGRACALWQAFNKECLLMGD